MRRMTILFIGVGMILGVFVAAPGVIRAEEAKSVPAPADIGPVEADRLVREEKAALIDVRTQAEYVFVGHPAGAVNIPWELWNADTYQWTLNPLFDERVKARFTDPNQPLVVICRSANRSRVAGERLLQAGYRRVYNLLEGFEGDKDPKTGLRTLNGWRNRGLPTSYDLDRKLLYFP